MRRRLGTAAALSAIRRAPGLPALGRTAFIEPGLAAATEIDEILDISRSNQKLVDLAASGPVCVQVVVAYTCAEQRPALGALGLGAVTVRKAGSDRSVARSGHPSPETVGASSYGARVDSEPTEERPT